MKRILVAIIALVSIQISFAQEKPVRIIFDSDMGPDYDDVGAITILHALADSGYAEILATVSSTKYEGVAGVLNLFNTYFNRPNTPIGVPKGKASEEKDWQHWTDSILAKYPHRIKKNLEVPDAVEVYRKVLASQPDKSVTIVTVGFLTNLANLLDTKADKYSLLSGKELISKKVKQLVSMAGGFPSGREFNVFTDSSASKKVFENWPTPVLFDGFEIGVKIKTGLPLIKNEKIKNSPVKDVFNICIPMSKGDAAGRMSWDEVATFIAIKGYEPWFNVKTGRIIVEDNGSNKWDNNGSGQSYIEFSKSVPEIESVLNKLMMHQPK
jgi:pyrimidine-specific ribonucleoside hydrolase